MESDISIDDPNQRHVRKIQTFGDHLRTDQDINLPTAKRAQRGSISIFSGHGVCVHACGMRGRKQLLHQFNDLLGSVSAVANSGVATARTFLRRYRLITAEMAFEAVFAEMKGQWDAAVRTFAHIPAFRAEQGRSEAAPVKEQDRLFALLQAILDGLRQTPGKDRRMFTLSEFLAEIDYPNQRELAIVNSSG